MQKKLLFCLLLAATLSAPLAAQTPTYDISGTVTDAVTGEPLPGVFITYDKRGAQSDYNGRFQLRNVPAGHVALKTMYYSAYPMVTQEIDLRCDTTVHFRLTEQVTHLDEVVVTGTRTPKRLAESPVLTSVITTQEIQRAGSTSTMEVLTDAATKEMIWREGDTLYYKEGVTDPDYCVLRFTATDGRYYHDFSSEDFTIE